MRTQKISVLIIESHPLMREALCTAIADEPGLTIAAQAAEGVEALRLMEVTCPDVVLLSLPEPSPGFLAPLDGLHRAFPAMPILALTANELPEQRLAVLASGARAMLTKTASRQELLQAVRSLRTGR